MPFLPRIAIVGGGPSGLALGLLLLQRGIRPTIYELRNRMTPQEITKPSGMLDLHEESGQKVLRDCGLWSGFEAALGDCSEACRVRNPQGQLLHSDEGNSSRPEIPRNSLTDLFVKKIPDGIIKWNHKITAVKKTKNSSTGATEVTLDLGANGSATYDFVVGADGAWSRVRKLITDVKPFYTGAQYITATARNASTKFPHLLELTGSGALMALGGGNGILTHRGPQDSIRVYAALSTPDENWAKANGLEGKTAAEIKPTLLSDQNMFGKWAPNLKELLATVCDEETNDNPGTPADVLPLYMLPVGHRWDYVTGATLVGDSAHLMTPWAGEGVNLALWDSLDLAHTIEGVPEVENAAAWQTALEPRVRDFEETMFARAEEKAEETARNKDMFMSEHGGQMMADIFKQYYDAPPTGGN